MRYEDTQRRYPLKSVRFQSPEQVELVLAAAASTGQSFNAFVLESLAQRLEREGAITSK